MCTTHTTTQPNIKKLFSLFFCKLKKKLPLTEDAVKYGRLFIITKEPEKDRNHVVYKYSFYLLRASRSVPTVCTVLPTADL